MNATEVSKITMTANVRHLLRGRGLSTARRVLLEGGLAPQSARELTVPVPATDGRPVVRMLDVFLVRGGGDEIYAYENYCPHAGGPLNLLPDRFLSRDKKHILCATHGAKFTIHDGVCVRGPCAGECLNALPTEQSAAGDVSASERALEELCEGGGGAFMEVPIEPEPGRRV